MLDIHAFSGACEYLEKYDGIFTEFFILTDIDIAAGIGTGNKENVQQKWGLAGNVSRHKNKRIIIKVYNGVDKLIVTTLLFVVFLE